MFCFGAASPCASVPLLFLVAVASLAPLVPPLRLVAVVLVLDVWSVLGLPHSFPLGGWGWFVD